MKQIKIITGQGSSFLIASARGIVSQRLNNICSLKSIRLIASSIALSIHGSGRKRPLCLFCRRLYRCDGTRISSIIRQKKRTRDKAAAIGNRFRFTVSRDQILQCWDWRLNLDFRLRVIRRTLVWCTVWWKQSGSLVISDCKRSCPRFSACLFLKRSYIQVLEFGFFHRHPSWLKIVFYLSALLLETDCCVLQLGH